MYPKAAPDIVDVMRRCRHASPNLGDWCAFGCLDPSRNICICIYIYIYIYTHVYIYIYIYIYIYDNNNYNNS